LAKAEQTLQQALSLYDLVMEGHIELGLVYALQGRLVEAEAELLHAAELDPEGWASHTALFNFYYAYNTRPDRFETAVRHAVSAKDIRPESARSWNNLGTASFMLQDYEAASEAWGHSLELEPTRTAYTNTGVALYYSGRFAEAAAMQRKATELAPDDHRSWGRLGDSLSMLGDQPDETSSAYQAAIQNARASLTINDQDWRTWGHLATYLAFTDQHADALDAAEKAVEISAGRSEALYYSALAHHAVGNMETVLETLQKAVAKDNNYRHLIAAEPLFADLKSNLRFQRIIGIPNPVFN
jgi:tetratricopeptide (TPR) repeat protein